MARPQRAHRRGAGTPRGVLRFVAAVGGVAAVVAIVCKAWPV